MKKTLLIALLVFSPLVCLSQATWIGGTGTSWHTAANWNTGLVPDSNTDVIVPGGNIVDINSNAVAKSLTFNGIDFLNSILTINGNLTLANESNFNLNARVNWSSGTISCAGGINSASDLHFVGASAKALNNTNLNASHSTIDGSGNLAISNSTFNVSTGGVLQILTGWSLDGSGNSKLILDHGFIIVNAPDSSVIFNVNAEMSGDSHLNVGKGTATFNGTNNTFGDIAIFVGNPSTPAELNFNGYFTCNGTISGPVSQPFNMNGTLNIPVAATFEFSTVNAGGGNYGMNWKSGTITGGGVLTNLGKFEILGDALKQLTSNTTINNDGTIKYSGAGDVYMTDATINNTGDIDVQGTGNFYLNNSVLDNKEAGTINLASTGNISANASVTELFKNEGILLRSTSNGTTKVNCRFHNSGDIEVTSGTLNITGNVNEFNGGMYNVSSGASLNVQSFATFSGALTGTLDGPMTIVNNFDVPALASWNFVGGSGLHWLSGFMGGGGTLTNLGTLNCSGAQPRYISPSTTLANLGTININGNDLILTDSTLNNLPSGVINLQTNHGLSLMGSSIDLLTNSGTINATAPGTAYIRCRTTNSGTINVTSGTLDFYATGFYQFNGGTYNVSSGSALNCNIAGSLSGTLSGVLDGPMNLNTNFDVPTSATNNTVGSAGLHWVSGFAGGGGTFNNATVLHLSGSFDRYLNNNLTLNNSGVIDFTAGNLYLSESTINNTASGIIDLKSDGTVLGAASSAFAILNNTGLLKKSNGGGTSGINLTLNNDGIVDVQSGTLNLAGSVGILNNNANGYVMGTGAIILPYADKFENNGTFSPGGHPGILTAIGNYESNPGAKLAVELNGLTSGLQYDLLSIIGDAIMQGSVETTLGFPASVNDEFVIATTSGNITAFSMAPTTTAIYNGTQYQFSVTMRSNNEVVLTVTGLENQQSPLESGISVSPNPAGGEIWLQNTTAFPLSSAQILDMNGRIIQIVDLQTNLNEQMINITELSSGVYFLKANSGEKSVIRKIVKR